MLACPTSEVLGDRDIPTSPLMESTPVARDLGISVSRLQQLADKLDPPVLRTTSGRRVFRVEDLEALRAMRETAREGRSPRDAA